MTIERKVLALDTAMVDAAAGIGTGYGAVFGNVDDGGDVIRPGFFAPVLDDFLRDGFMSWSHDWTTPVAWPTKATEDGRGLDLAWQYHTTPAAQVARTITAERLAAGKSMGLSIGYEVDEEVRQKDGTRLLIRAKRLFEVGFALVPMNRLAGVTATKSYDAKGAIAPVSTATTDDEWDAAANEANLDNDAGAAVFRRAYAWLDPDGDPDTKAAYKFLHHVVAADGTVGAASTVACSAGIAVLNGGRGGADIPASDRVGVHRHLAAHLADADREAPPLKGLPDGLTYGSQSDYVMAELAAWRDRTRDLLTKEGRAISTARRDRLVGHVTALEQVLEDLRGLLSETEPPAKSVAAWTMRARARLAAARAEYLITP